MDLGLRWSNTQTKGTFPGDLNNYSLSVNAGKTLNDYTEGTILGAFGILDYWDIKNFMNIELAWDLVLKYEKVLASGAKVVPYGRAGATMNYVSNEVTDYGYTAAGQPVSRTTGSSYLDFYGNYSAGLSYVAPNNTWAISSEYGFYSWLGGDIDWVAEPDQEAFWSTHLYFETSDDAGIKFQYSYEIDNEKSTYGIYYTREF